MDPTQQPEVVVILVHGTFAQGAHWINSGPLCQNLLDRFGPAVRLQPFTWSGKNSVEARLLARDKLLSKLDDLREQFPHAAQIVVAHSHGGNVAIYAANSLDDEDHNLYGIVTLATPFLHASVQPVSKATSLTIRNALSGLLAFVVMCISIFFPLGWILRLSLIATISLVAFLIGGLFFAVMGAMTDIAKTTAESFKAKFGPGIDLCILRVVGDEASMALATAQFTAWISARLYARLAKIQPVTMKENLRSAFRLRRPPWFFWPVFLCMAVALGLLYVVLADRGLDREQASLVLQIMGVLLANVLLVACTTWGDGWLLGLAFLLVAVFRSLRILWLGTYISNPEMGGPILRACIAVALGCMLEVSTESTPSGEWNVIQLEQQTPADNEPSERLVHSAYDDPRVHELVVRYVGRCLSEKFFQGNRGVASVGGTPSPRPLS